jgi:hypothetical protein
VLGPGDELLLGSDGVFDHLAEHGEAAVVEHLGRPGQPDTLLGGVRGLLGPVLGKEPQKDDITAVLLRRRPKPAAVPGSLPVPSPRHEAGNV